MKLLYSTVQLHYTSCITVAIWDVICILQVQDRSSGSTFLPVQRSKHNICVSICDFDLCGVWLYIMMVDQCWGLTLVNHVLRSGFTAIQLFSTPCFSNNFWNSDSIQSKSSDIVSSWMFSANISWVPLDTNQDKTDQDCVVQRSHSVRTATTDDRHDIQ